MSDQDVERVIRLLEEIRDGQKLQLERQAEAIEAQKARLAGLSSLSGQAGAVGESAERVVARASTLVSAARLVLFLGVPIALLLFGLVCWLAFGHVPR